jgi:DNA-binding transcriptional regulator GbsR (MarR family)
MAATKRSGPRPVRTERSEAGMADFIERFAGTLVAAGMPLQPSRIFAAVLADDDGRMTAAELSDRLHLSAGSISGAVQYLVRLDLIRRERQRGSRRDVYVVMDDAWHDTLLSSDRLLASMTTALKDGVSQAGQDTPAGKRLELSLQFLLYLTQEMDHIAAGWERRRRELDHR